MDTLSADFSPFILKAPAKINWFLVVNGLRDDGYHEIISLMQMVSIYDELIFEPSDKIEILTDADIPLEENLIYRAANLIWSSWRGHIKSKGVRITLKKEIPVAAGLGGGSSDAATTIVGLNTFWGLNLGTKDLIEIGASLGSDVPFFLGSPAAIVRRRGDIIQPVKLKRSYPLLLVKPPFRIETRWAYKEFDYLRKAKGPKQTEEYIAEFINILNDSKLQGLQGSLTGCVRNDLEDVVSNKYPVIGEINRTLKKKGALFSIMSGSGPTVIGIFDTPERAKEAMKVIPDRFWCRLARTLI